MQTIYITGTHCPACKKLIERKISEIVDVLNVNVDFITGKTTIDSNRLIDESEINLSLEGMPCAQKS